MGDGKRAPRPAWIEGDVAFIPLTKGYVARLDAADLPEVSGWLWNALEERRKSDGHLYTVYARRANSILLHRVIMRAPKEMKVDHISGDGLDNRRSNLRLATPSQNQFNKRRSVANTSGFKGVSWISEHRKWKAAIRHSGRTDFLGYFQTAEEAAQAYANASLKIHGQFGRVQ